MASLLLLDDDQRLLELFAQFLTRRGHAVRTARSFAEARARLAEGAPDLLLSDLDLGAERGEEELPALSQAGLLPPTLVVSGYLDAALEARLRALPGVVGILAKPFDLAALEARIAAALAQTAGARTKSAEAGA